MEDTQQRIQRFFRARSKTLLAAAEQAVTGHGTTSGDHREEEVRQFLREVLPERFRVDHGVVFAQDSKSRQADVILWEASDFPRIPQGDAKVIFAESVRMIIEVKSDWSTHERDDIWKKSKLTQSIRRARSQTIEGRLASIERGLSSLYDSAGLRSPYAFKARHHSPKQRLSFAGVVLRGGQTVKPPDLGTTLLHRHPSELPDLLLLLQPGHVIRKLYDAHTAETRCLAGAIEFYAAGDDALLLFMSFLMADATEQAEYLSHPFRLDTYCSDVLRACQPRRFDYGPAEDDAAEARFVEAKPPRVTIRRSDERLSTSEEPTSTDGDDEPSAK